MFEQPNIAGHQGGRGEAEDLPERKIPWHDREYHPEWLPEHRAARGRGLDQFLLEKALRVLSIISAADDALAHFVARRADWLAHFEGNRLGECGDLLFEQISGLLENGGTLKKTALAMSPRSTRGRCELLLDGPTIQLLIFAQLFARCRIDRGNRHPAV